MSKSSTDSDIVKIVNNHAVHGLESEHVDNIEEINHIFREDSIINIIDRLEKSDTEFA